jgi:hypothetical protein
MGTMIIQNFMGKPEGKRPLGRPKRMWIGIIRLMIAYSNEIHEYCNEPSARRATVSF